MLRVAITGPVGQGNSQLLARLAELLEARGEAAAGFIAQADGPRLGPGAGASAYRLQPLGALPGGLPSPPWLWAERQEGAIESEAPAWAGGMRYRFHPEALDHLKAAAEAGLLASKASQSPTSFLLLDEFGKAEAAGGGWLPLWPLWAQLQAGVLVVSVREGQLEGAAEALGGPWDWVLAADAPESWSRLTALATEARDWRRVGAFGAAGGAFEASVGAWLHGTMLPGRGLVMASAQAALLTRLARGLAEPGRVAWAGPVAAGLKAFSPTGSRLRPMLAISIQALLYGATARVGHGQPWSLVLASALVGAWAAAQSVFLSWLLLGEALWKALEAGRLAVEAGVKGLGAPLWVAGLLDWRWILPAYVLLWALVAAVAGATALRGAPKGAPELVRQAGLGVAQGGGHLAQHTASKELLSVSPEALGTMPEAPRGAAPPAGPLGLLWAWARELARPSAWLPVLLVVAVLAATGTAWQELAWVLLRAAAIVLVLVALLRRSDLGKITAWLARRGAWGPALALGSARQAVALGRIGSAGVDPGDGMAQDQAGAAPKAPSGSATQGGRDGAPPNTQEDRP